MWRLSYLWTIHYLNSSIFYLINSEINTCFIDFENDFSKRLDISACLVNSNKEQFFIYYSVGKANKSTKLQNEENVNKAGKEKGKKRQIVVTPLWQKSIGISKFNNVLQKDTLKKLFKKNLLDIKKFNNEI